MCVCQNIGGGIRFLNQIDCDLGLWAQPIPQVWWEVVGYTDQDAEKMGFEVAYGNHGCIASVASWRHLFDIQFARVTNVILHVVRNLIVKDMFLGNNVGPFQLEQECVVCPYHLGILMVLRGLDKDGIAIDFHHNHDVLVASKRMDGELAGLVGKLVLHTIFVWVYTSRTFLPWRWEVLHVSNGAAFALVDPTFFLFGLDAPLQF
jgi:hypothetical protein